MPFHIFLAVGESLAVGGFLAVDTPLRQRATGGHTLTRRLPQQSLFEGARFAA